MSLSRCARPLVAEIMTALGTPTAKQWLEEQSGAAASSPGVREWLLIPIPRPLPGASYGTSSTSPPGLGHR